MRHVPEILDLSYTPSVFVDTKDMPEPIWQSYRRQGIGGSDAPIVTGQSPWNTPLGLYYDKLGIEPLHPEPKDEVPLKVGKRLEPLIAELFAAETGYTVYKDTNMYQHPLYPFMLVNLDYISILPDGSKAIVECKSGSVYTEEAWADGRIPQHYLDQLRHEMCVMNMDKIFVAYLLGNSRKGFGIRTLTRDLARERELIRSEAAFWSHVETRVPPKLTHPDAELAFQVFNRYIESKAGAEVTLDPGSRGVLEQIIELNTKLSGLEKQKKELDQQRKALYIRIAEQMGEAEAARCDDITLTYKTSIRDGIDLGKLKAAYPEAYSACRRTSVSRTFRLHRPRTGEQEKAA